MSKFTWSAAALTLLAASSLVAQTAQPKQDPKKPAAAQVQAKPAPAKPAAAAPAPAAAATQAKPKADSSKADKKAARHADGTTATADQVKKAQQALADKGLYKGKVTGRSNAAFRTSLKQYQKDNGLKATGRLNQETLAKLGVA
jgi:putative peptidoglycan binding protein